MKSDDVSLVREAMERTADGLPALPDLVPGAVSQGRRRRTRARLAVTAGTFSVATLATLGAVALPGDSPGSSVASTGTGSPSVAPAPYRTPVHVESTPGRTTEDSLYGLPHAERQRIEGFQQRAAVALDETLPDSVGMIRPLDSSIDGYRGEKDGTVFHVTFEVRPGDGVAPCRDTPAKNLSCLNSTLPGGIEASVRVTGSDTSATTSISLGFTYGDSDVLLRIYPDAEELGSVPVTAQQLLDGARESGLLEVVRYADEHPVLTKRPGIQGG